MQTTIIIVLSAPELPVLTSSNEYKQTCKKQLFVISHNLNVRSKEVSIVSLPQDILKRDFKRHMLKRSEKQYATGAAMALRRR